MSYFFDSYAIIELVKGNPAYSKYSKEEFIITVFNLAEIYYSTLREFGEERAEQAYDDFKDCIVSLDDKVIKEAMKFKLKNKKKNLSYADCIGYAYANEKKLLFLTGDKQFKEMKNVEYTPK